MCPSPADPPAAVPSTIRCPHCMGDLAEQPPQTQGWRAPGPRSTISPQSIAHPNTYVYARGGPEDFQPVFSYSDDLISPRIPGPGRCKKRFPPVLSMATVRGSPSTEYIFFTDSGSPAHQSR